MQRRDFLICTLAAAPYAAIVGGGFLPRSASAAWSSEAFHAETLSDAESRLFGDRAVEDTDQVLIEAPDIAENGRVVPVEIKIQLPNPKSVSLFSDGNPFPLLARAHFTDAVLPRVAIRVKMGESADLIAVVEADGRLFRAVRSVKVTAGGCGG